MQGSQDIAVHVGTLHFTAKAVIDAFEGDIHPGDVFAINDPYLGGTHFNDVQHRAADLPRRARSSPSRSPTGHWADVGGSVPGSFDITAKEHFGEGLRIPPVRIWSQGRYLADVARLIISNSRAPEDTEGDLHAQAEATAVCEREILRLVEQVRRRHDPDRDGRGPGLRRAPDAPARRRAARRHVGVRGLHRLRPQPRRGPGPDQGQADDRRRPAALRPLRARTPRSGRSSTPASAARSRAWSPEPRPSSPTCR